MISYVNIGRYGRLGNQLFQFASTIGIARKLGYEVYFPKENITEPAIEDFRDGIRREVYFDVPKIFQVPESLLKSRQDIVFDKQAQEPHFHYSELMFGIPDGTNLIGYYQTEKYFEHCEEEIRSVLTFSKEIEDSAKQVMTKYKVSDRSTVSIHVRVGDYAGLQQFHPICSPDYYVSAAENFRGQNCQYLIFSDNIEYCKNIFGNQEMVSYICDNSPEVDMCLMSMCDHNIIANSSFSWWAAWLNKNPNKKVVAPKNWFGPAYHYQNTSDLYCKNWIIT